MKQIDVASIRLDGGTQPRAHLDLVAVAEYAEAMRGGAEFPPVVVFYDGEAHWLADGFHRVNAALQAGIAKIAADVRQGTRRDAVLHSVGANASHGMRRTNEDKRRAVMTLLQDDEWRKWSDNKIAQACGVSHPTVSSIRSSLVNFTSENDAERTYLTKHGTVATMDTARIGRQVEVLEPIPEAESIFTDTFKNAVGYERAIVVQNADGAEMVVRGRRLAPLMSSASDEWYTPPHVAGLARAVLGTIDLDPASSDEANKTIRAKRIYTRTDDGLAQKWRGRVYMNPPYGDVIGQWVDKLVAEYRAGNVAEAIALLPGRIDTQWFQPLFDFPICCIRGRLKFSGDNNSATFPSVAVYMGKAQPKFARHFAELGAILARAEYE